jgi:hypothetical protein
MKFVSTTLVDMITVVGRLNFADELLFSTLNSWIVSSPGGRRILPPVLRSLSAAPSRSPADW